MLAVFNNGCNEKIIEFNGDRVVYCVKSHKEFLKGCGIPIPPGKKEDFEGRKIVYFPKDKDPDKMHALFKKAFFEIYYPDVLNHYSSTVVFEIRETSPRHCTIL